MRGKRLGMRGRGLGGRGGGGGRAAEGGQARKVRRVRTRYGVSFCSQGIVGGCWRMFGMVIW
jgi:hypothetical protein